MSIVALNNPPRIPIDPAVVRSVFIFVMPGIGMFGGSLLASTSVTSTGTLPYDVGTAVGTVPNTFVKFTEFTAVAYPTILRFPEVGLYILSKDTSGSP